MSAVVERKGMPDGWRDVAMPPGVVALPRTRSGIPITYTVAWSSEARPVAREDPILRGLVAPGTMALFHSGAQGEGTPKLNVGSVDRVRRVTVMGLCQVCGRTLSARRPRWLCDLRNHGQEIDIGGRMVPLVVDGWSCEPCLAYGLRVCPGLLRRFRSSAGSRSRRWTTTSWIQPTSPRQEREATVAERVRHADWARRALADHRREQTDDDVIDAIDWLLDAARTDKCALVEMVDRLRLDLNEAEDRLASEQRHSHTIAVQCEERARQLVALKAELRELKSPAPHPSEIEGER